MRIKLISNPNSGHNRKNPKHIEKLSQILGDHIYLPPLEKLEETILQFQKEALDILAIAGGDGTVHQVLSAVHRVYRDKNWPQIALLPSGTMNNIARNVGVRKNSIQQLAKIMNTLKEGALLQTSTHHPLIFDEEKAGFIFGQGGVSNVLKEYEKGGNTSQLKAFLLIMRTIASAFINGPFVRRLFAPVEMEVYADGIIQKHKKYTVSVLSSISNIGFGFRPCYAPYKDPSIAQFIGFTRHPVFTALCLPKIRLALPIKHSSVQDITAQSFVLITKKPMLYTIDGDLYECETQLDIRIGKPVTFVT
jgi:diacylglycerol kinase family enzyme